MRRSLITAFGRPSLFALALGACGVFGSIPQVPSSRPSGTPVATVGTNTVTWNGSVPASGSVTLNGPAPAGGAQVALSSNNPAASVPASVTVAAGAASATFNITTSAVAASTGVSIAASYGGTQTAALTVVPPRVAALSLSNGSVTGGTPVTGTVSLDGPAPAGGRGRGPVLPGSFTLMVIERDPAAR